MTDLDLTLQGARVPVNLGESTSLAAYFAAKAEAYAPSAATRALIDAVRGYGFVPVVDTRLAAGDDPTLTLGVAGAASTLNALGPHEPLVSRFDARLQWLYAVPAAVGAGYPDEHYMKPRGAYYGAINGGGDPLYSGTFMALEFVHTGTTFEIALKGGSGGALRLLVDGIIAAVEAAPGGGLFYLKVVFPTSRARRITIEAAGPPLSGINVVASGDVTATARAYPLVTVIGDSFPEPTGPDYAYNGEGAVMGRALGFNTAIAGVGGSGIVTTGGNNVAGFPKVNWQNATRLKDLTLATVTSAQTGQAVSPAMGVVMGSINDPGANATDQGLVRDGAWVLIDAWIAVNPGKPLVFFGPTYPNGVPTQATYRIRDGIEEACGGAAQSNVWFIDRLGPGPFLRGGASGATGAGTQAELYTSNSFGDTTHPNTAGHALDGRWMARELRRLILSEFA